MCRDDASGLSRSQLVPSLSSPTLPPGRFVVFFSTVLEEGRGHRSESTDRPDPEPGVGIVPASQRNRVCSNGKREEI